MAAVPLSVILCCHGRPGYLRACLAGLAAQSCRDFELLVVDSGSPPKEAGAIAALAREAGARLLCSSSPGPLTETPGDALAPALQRLLWPSHPPMPDRLRRWTRPEPAQPHSPWLGKGAGGRAGRRAAAVPPLALPW